MNSCPSWARSARTKSESPIAELKITDADSDPWEMCTHHVGESFRSVVQIELARRLSGFARSLSLTIR